MLIVALTGVARLCARHRWIAVGMWAVLLLPAVFFVIAGHAQYSHDVSVPGSESQRAMNLARKVIPGGVLPDTEQIVLHARRGTLADPLVHQQVEELLADVGKLPGVLTVADPFGPLGRTVLGVSPVSADGRTAVAPVIMKASALELDLGAIRRVSATARSYSGPELQVGLGGPGATALTSAGVPIRPLLAALAVALAVLCPTLRSRVAAMIAAVVAAMATVTTVAVTTVLSHYVLTTPFAALLGGMIALGVSLGGSVLVVYRAQTALARGVSPVDAATEAMVKSVAALASGGVCLSVAMTGVLLLNLGPLTGVALAAGVAGVLSALVTLTLLPALLVLGGTRMLGWLGRHSLTTTGRGLPHRPGVRWWWARQVGCHPAVAVAAACVLLVALAAPVVTLRLGGGDAGAEPTSATARRAYDVVSRDFFSGLNGPMLVVVDRGEGSRTVTVTDVVTALNTTPGVKHAYASFDSPESAWP